MVTSIFIVVLKRRILCIRSLLLLHLKTLKQYMRLRQAPITNTEAWDCVKSRHHRYFLTPWWPSTHNGCACRPGWCKHIYMLCVHTAHPPALPVELTSNFVTHATYVRTTHVILVTVVDSLRVAWNPSSRPSRVVPLESSRVVLSRVQESTRPKIECHE